MSYDLAVFAPSELSREGMHAFVTEIAGLHVEGGGDRSLTVCRGARQRYSFTIDGPDLTEPEDIPADVAAVVLGSRFLYTVMVEGSSETEIPHALRFARRLAERLDGAVIDQQTDALWSRSQSRKIRKPERESRVSTVQLEWFCLRQELAQDPPTLFLETVERMLPEALPGRFGEYEPFQGKFADVGPQGFASAWAEATSLLFFSASGPCIDGTLSAGPNESFPDRFWSMSLTFHAEPLQQPSWRDAVQRIFTTLADGLPAFYASAAVTGGHIWSGRSLWSDGATEWGVRPLRARDGWMGLSPVPTWWTWLGQPYLDAAGMLPPDRTTATARGVLVESSVQPTAADDLEPLNRWLPAALFASLLPNPGRQQPAPLLRAPSIPDILS